MMLNTRYSQGTRAVQGISSQAAESRGTEVVTAILRSMMRRGPLTAKQIDCALAHLQPGELTSQTASTMMTCLQGRPWRPRDFRADACVLEQQATPAFALLACALQIALRSAPTAAPMVAAVAPPVRVDSPVAGLVQAWPARPARATSPCRSSTQQAVPEMDPWQMDLSTQQLIDELKRSDEGFLRDRDIAKQIHEEFASSFKEDNDDFATTLKGYLRSGVISQEEFDAQAEMLTAMRSTK